MAVFPTGLGPGHPDYDRIGTAIVADPDDLDTAYFANRDGAVLRLTVPPEHSLARTWHDAKIARGELVPLDDNDVEEVTTDTTTGGNPGERYTITTWRRRTNDPDPSRPAA